MNSLRCGQLTPERAWALRKECFASLVAEPPGSASMRTPSGLREDICSRMLALHFCGPRPAPPRPPAPRPPAPPPPAPPAPRRPPSRYPRRHLYKNSCGVLVLKTHIPLPSCPHLS